MRGAGAGTTGRGQGQATPPAAGQKTVQEDGTVYVWAGPKHAIPCTNSVKSTRHLIGLIVLSSNSLKKTSIYIHAFHYITETFNTAYKSTTLQKLSFSSLYS